MPTFPAAVVTSAVISSTWTNALRQSVVDTYAAISVWVQDISANGHSLSGVNNVWCAAVSATDTITAPTITATGVLNAAAINLTGVLTVASITTSTTISANALSVVTSLSGATLGLTGAATVASVVASGSVGAATLTASGLITAGSIYSAGNLRFTGVGNKYQECESAHMAYYKKAGATNFYWRRSSTGLSGGSGETTMMELTDLSNLIVYGGAANAMSLVSSGGSDMGFVLTDANRSWKMGLNVAASGPGKWTLYNLSAGVNFFTCGDTDLTIGGQTIRLSTALPGPYADNAAASAAGLGQGRLYRDSSNNVKQVQ